MPITCFIRREIDSHQREASRSHLERWGSSTVTSTAWLAKPLGGGGARMACGVVPAP